MNLSQHFTLEEFTASDTALRLGIDNTMPEGFMVDARATAQMMERIREQLTFVHGSIVPVTITSAYRCPALNTAIGSHPTSDHIRMLAVDFRAPEFGTPLQICKALEPVMNDIGIGQMIYEHTWVHVSKRDPDKASNRVLTVRGEAYTQGIVEA